MNTKWNGQNIEATATVQVTELEDGAADITVKAVTAEAGNRTARAATYRIAAALTEGGPSGYRVGVDVHGCRVWIERQAGAPEAKEFEELKHAAMNEGFAGA